MSNKFIVRPKGESSVNITVRMKKSIQERFDELATDSGHSRNELLNQALEFALDNLEFINEKESKSDNK